MSTLAEGRSSLPPSREGRRNALRKLHTQVRTVDGMLYSEQREEEEQAFKRQKQSQALYQEQFLRTVAKNELEDFIAEATRFNHALDALNTIDKIDTTATPPSPPVAEEESSDDESLEGDGYVSADEYEFAAAKAKAKAKARARSLPPGWSMHRTDNNEKYYVNETTGESQWNIPRRRV